MEKYKQISDEHAHEFNVTQEMRQTQALVDEDSDSSMIIVGNGVTQDTF